MSGRENDGVETAAGATRDYPSAWGTPPGTLYSEERAAWVRRWAKLQQVKDVNKAEARRIHEEIRRELEHARETGH